MPGAEANLMVASSPPSRSITVANPAHALPRALDAFIGGLLELVIHSFEGVRGRFVGKPSVR
jgi:hypothetical protein